MLPSPSQLVEWKVRQPDGDIVCTRRRLPLGVIDLAVTFHGLLVASWTTTESASADLWVSAKRRAWESLAAVERPALS